MACTSSTGYCTVTRYVDGACRSDCDGDAGPPTWLPWGGECSPSDCQTGEAPFICSIIDGACNYEVTCSEREPGLSGTCPAIGGAGGTPGTGGTAGTAGTTGTTDGGADTADGSAGTAGTAGAGGTAGADGGGCQIAICDSHRVYACGDCSDNDADGRTDADDPLCVSACDNDEASFTINFPGVTFSRCADDCYFNGSASDPAGCFHDRQCDPSYAGDALCAYDPTVAACTVPVPQSCIDACLPLTPGGCDCFGCCELRQEPGVFRYLGRDEACSPETWSLCHPCQPEPSCFNACDRCERCLGDDPRVPPACP